MKKLWILYPDYFDLHDEFTCVTTDDYTMVEPLKARMGFIWGSCSVGVHETVLNRLSDKLIEIEVNRKAQHEKDITLLAKMEEDKSKGAFWINKDGTETPVKG